MRKLILILFLLCAYPSYGIDVISVSNPYGSGVNYCSGDTKADGEVPTWNNMNSCYDSSTPPGAGGGDSILINGLAVVDPDFTSTGSEISLTDTANVITFTIKDDIIAAANLADGDWGDISVATNAVTVDADVIDFDNIKYDNTLVGDPALGVDECYPVATATGGGFICEGSTADTNEQLYLFPDLNGADTTEYIVVADDANVSAAEAGFLDGVTSAIQTQIDSKEGTLTNEAGLETAIGGTDVVTVTTDDITSANLITLVSDESGTGVLTMGTSATHTTPIISGKINADGGAVNDDDCTGEQGLFWFDDTDLAFEFCNANSGVPTVLGGGSSEWTDDVAGSFLHPNQDGDSIRIRDITNPTLEYIDIINNGVISQVQSVGSDLVLRGGTGSEDSITISDAAITTFRSGSVPIFTVTGSGNRRIALSADSLVSWTNTSGNSEAAVDTAIERKAANVLSVAEDDYFAKETDAGITASVTQTQGQGALTCEICEISTVATTNDTVTLPTAIGGLCVKLINNGANTLQIFPASGDNAGAGVDTAVTLAAATNVEYCAYNATNWEQF